ncbi:MAG: SDR family NAD(P)-dependent oxidoreductase, partial [Dongiaceae bacterium]
MSPITDRIDFEEDRGGSALPLAGRRILITGAGAGIGAATAQTAVAQGACVAILDRDGDAASRTASALGDDRALAATGDVTDEAAVEQALDRMAAAWGGVDDLVNNAGIYDHGPLLELSLAQWQRVFDVNLFAAIAASNAAVRRMRKGGSIVNVASALGQVAAPGRGPY